MNREIRFTLGAGFVLASVLGVGALSRAPYTAESARHAFLRLAWRARGERVQECRRRTPEELAKLPVHMREDEVCEGRILPYRLHVTIDERSVADMVVRAAGAREDRPIYVYQELSLPPGTHRLRINFARQGEPKEKAAEGREPHFEPEGRGTHATPGLLTLDTTVVLAVRDIALVTYDPEAQRLILKGPS